MLITGHGAANVTLGIPRLREIVMTASQKPKTPSMTMKVRPGVSLEDVGLFCKRASRVKLSQVVENVTVKEQMIVDGQARRTRFNVDIKFFPKDEYTAEYDVDPLEILAVFSTRFPLTLKKEMQIEMKKLDADLKSQIAELGKGKKVRARENEVEQDDVDEEDTQKRRKDADEESEEGDGDADDEKRARQKKEQATYESDESDPEDIGEFDDAAIEAEFASETGSAGDEDEGWRIRKKEKIEVKKVGDLFQSNLNHATSFSFTESGCVFQLEVSLFFKTITYKSLIGFIPVPYGHAKAAVCWYCGTDMPGHSYT